jgi:hypothetical protein
MCRSGTIDVDARAGRARRGRGARLCINMYTRQCARRGLGEGEGVRGSVCQTDRPTIDRAAALQLRGVATREGGLRKGPLNRRSLPLHRILISATTSRSSVRLSTDMKKKHTPAHTRTHRHRQKEGKKKERNSSRTRVEALSVHRAFPAPRSRIRLASW